MQADLLIINAAQLATPFHPPEEEWGGLRVIENAAIACASKKIVSVGETAEVMQQVQLTENTEILDASGKTVLPGFVDAHTHLVFAATREDEFELRIAGLSYQQIAAAGGGIRSSVRKVRGTSKEELIKGGLSRLDQFLAHGTTTIEAKSGYGLNLENEIKILQTIRELNKQHPVKIIPTFLGAHNVPDEYRSDRGSYIASITEEMMPRVAEEKLARYCDVFCEKGVFSLEEARRILTTALDYGLLPKIHADQLSNSGGALLAAEIGAVSADHLDHIDDTGIQMLAKKGIVPVLLPGAVFFLNLDTYAPAAEMMSAGLPVAIATDYNPGSCPSLSMPMMMSLACVEMHMTPAEVLVACTEHAALAIGEHDRVGILQVGKNADITIWDAPNYKYIPYHFGVNLLKVVVKDGAIVWRDGRTVY